jgi:hypothetical protein
MLIEKRCAVSSLAGILCLPLFSLLSPLMPARSTYLRPLLPLLQLSTFPGLPSLLASPFHLFPTSQNNFCLCLMPMAHQPFPRPLMHIPKRRAPRYHHPHRSLRVSWHLFTPLFFCYKKFSHSLNILRPQNRVQLLAKTFLFRHASLFLPQSIPAFSIGEYSPLI